MPTPAELHLFDEFSRLIPAQVDLESIRRDWLALKPPYQVESCALPVPVWAQRGYTDTGEEAWQRLRQDIVSIPVEKPICIYIHVPFCANKCRFCYSYSFKLTELRRADHIGRYVDLLEQELRLWASQGLLSQRPVSTIHFGGGTPSFLGVEPFKRLVESCVGYFNTSSQTEWALESTVSELSNEMLSLLYSLGFRRLHIGVQSLEDPVRSLIGRRQGAAAVIDKIVQVIELGWIVTVDLICGLPGQTVAGFLADLQKLIQLGIPGFSIYELVIYSQNRRWAENHNLIKKGHLSNYFLYLAAVNLLVSSGYKMNLFDHFAIEPDKNLYNTFPERGEDLLAVGAIADGVFGDYHYRHPVYDRYCRTMSATFPALEGGLRRDRLENYLHPVITTLLSGRIPLKFQPNLEIPLVNSSECLLHCWLESGLLVNNARVGYLNLTASGSWFIGNMIAELVALMQHHG